MATRRHRWEAAGVETWDRVVRRVFQCRYCGVRVLSRSDLGPHLAHREMWIAVDGTRAVMAPLARRPRCSRTATGRMPTPAPRRRRTITARRIRTSLAQLPDLEAEPVDLGGACRPRTRAECQGGPRPCPWVSCRHHLYLDVLPGGAIHVPHPEVAVEDMRWTCALDVAERGEPALVEEVAELLNVSRERVRQIEAKALRRLRDASPGVEMDAVTSL